MVAPIPVKSLCLHLFAQNILLVKKCNSLYLGLVMPSGGWWSPIDLLIKLAFFVKIYCFNLKSTKSVLVSSRSSLVVVLPFQWGFLAKISTLPKLPVSWGGFVEHLSVQNEWNLCQLFIQTYHKIWRQGLKYFLLVWQTLKCFHFFIYLLLQCCKF